LREKERRKEKNEEPIGDIRRGECSTFQFDITSDAACATILLGLGELKEIEEEEQERK